MRLSPGDRHSRIPRLASISGIGLLILMLVTITAVAAGCGYGSTAGDGGTISTNTTEAVPTTGTAEPAETTSTIPSQPTTTGLSSTTTTTDAVETTTVNVYFSADEKMSAAARTILKTQQVGAAAMKALLEGPTQAEAAFGRTTSIPKGTTFLGLNITGGIATVDLSAEYASGGGSLSMATRLAQVVFTLTQFPTVQGVSFKLDGKPVEVFGGEGIILDHPVSRKDYEELSPAILVEWPTAGNTVGSPLRVTGTANVFEASFRLNITDWDGRIVADKVVMATSGTGTRGTFDVTVPFKIDRAGLGALIVFAESAKDGSPIDVVEIPLQVEK